MDARPVVSAPSRRLAFPSTSWLLLGGLLFLAAADQVHAAGHRTKNFVAIAPTPQLAKEVAETAEYFRKLHADEWLGRELPDWASPCPIQVRVSPHLGAGGATSFMFEGRTPYGWRMNIQGSRERLLDSVVPHEVLHTVFATHFGQPLPRWADEGAATNLEHVSETSKYQRGLIEFLRNERGIPFSDMYVMTEYPGDILPLYSQAHSLVKFLLMQGGKQKYVRYVEDGLATGDWTRVTREHYGFETIKTLQNQWVTWVAQGSPNMPGDLVAPTGPSVASAARPNAAPPPTPRNNVLARADTQPSVSRDTPGNGSWYARGRVRVADTAKQVASREGPTESPGAPATRQAPSTGPRVTVLQWTGGETVRR